MTTGAEVLNIVPKKIIGSNDFGARFSTYLRDLVKQSNKRVFDTDLTHGTGLTLSADGNDKFKIDGTSIVSDGDGHFLDIDSGINSGIQFENSNLVDYYVALKYALKPSGIVINPGTGQPDYVKYIEEIGEQADPNSVIDNGTNITFVVDSICEAGVDNTGREILVYMKIPAGNAITEAIAIETCTVFYSGGNNKITTSGILGQSTVSTIASEYEVILLGPTVKRYIDLRTQNDYGFVGIVTGAGAGNPPTTFDVSDQKVLPVSWVTALFDGIPHDLIPAADNTYSLGSTSRKWSDIYTYNLTVAADFLPLVTLTQDLGSSSLRWQKLYSEDISNSGIITTHKAEFDATAGDGFDSDVPPVTNNTYDLGSGSRRWKKIYSVDADISNDLDVGNDLSVGNNLGVTGQVSCSTISPGQFLSNLIPFTDDFYDLGSGSDRWENLYVSKRINCDELLLTGSVVSHLLPDVSVTYNLGSSSYLWNNVYSNTIRTQDLLVSSGVLGSSFKPDTDDSVALGLTSLRWSKLWCHDADFDEDVNIQELYVAGSVHTDLIPSIDKAKDLGSTSYMWQHIYSEAITVEGLMYCYQLSVASSGSYGVNSHLIPTTTDSWHIGDSTDYYEQLYVNHLYYKTSATFDDYDDLALVEAYGPSNEIIEKEKFGQKRNICKGNVENIPWPMLGPEPSIDKNGAFIHSGDSIMFLLGAIKQLSLRQKSDNEELKELIKRLEEKIEKVET